jgi:hypothetical protein
VGSKERRIKQLEKEAEGAREEVAAERERAQKAAADKAAVLGRVRCRAPARPVVCAG